MWRGRCYRGAVQLRTYIAPILALTVLAASAAAQAVVEGRVKLPEAKTGAVVVKRYEVVTKAGVVAMNPPLAVVWLEGEFPAATKPMTAQLAQKDLSFAPALLAVRVGTVVEFPNEDDTYHNVFSFSAAKRFDLGRYRPEDKPVPTQTFDKAGLVTLRCDIHEHMRALVLVVDSPHFVKTQPDGSYKLSGLPAGRYKLKAWLDSKTTLERDVELKAGAPLRVDFP